MRAPQTAEPVRVRKAAWVLTDLDRSKGRFAGLSVHLPYRADDVAHCAPERCAGTVPHDPPHRQSSCGFHGSTHDALSWLLPDAVLLDVELFGRVVRHERGWRASRQRVLGAVLPRACRECRRSNEAMVVVTLPSRVVPGWWSIGTRCLICANQVDSLAHSQLISMGELASILGTEMSWADPATTSEALRYLRAA